MTQQSNSLPPLSLGRSEIVGEQAFEGDLLSRKKLAERLTGYLDRLKEGAVLAIDAQWGDGKTWFGRNWAKSLEDDGHKVVFIDAFEQDYIEDPFLLIAAEIAEALKEEDEGIKEFREKAAGVMKTILPVGTKVLMNIAGRVVLGSGDASEEIKDAFEAASDSTADAASEWIKEKLQDHAQEKASLQHFRNELEAVANAQEKPIVIFIDELDRCRPTFAVRLIERVKHFFDVPNVVFVLLINRDQLEKAIKGVYGTETDAAAYLGKFVNFFFLLPILHRDSESSKRYIASYVGHVLKRYNFDSGRETSVFKETFAVLAAHYNLTLRDIERAIALYAGQSHEAKCRFNLTCAG
jgi:predicted KAP-like P-loop ATPase